jgi:hypothetical protein
MLAVGMTPDLLREMCPNARPGLLRALDDLVKQAQDRREAEAKDREEEP